MSKEKLIEAPNAFVIECLRKSATAIQENDADWTNESKWTIFNNIVCDDHSEIIKPCHENAAVNERNVLYIARANPAKILNLLDHIDAQAERIKVLEELCDHYVPKNQGFQDFNCTQCETTWKGEIESVCPVCKSED